MNKKTSVVLNLILAGIVSAISFLGFKKGVEILENKITKKSKQPPKS
jgi:EamA domain-containing membrane protein RarD